MGESEPVGGSRPWSTAMQERPADPGRSPREDEGPPPGHLPPVDPQRHRAQAVPEVRPMAILVKKRSGCEVLATADTHQEEGH